MKIKINTRLIDRVAICDLLLSIGYIFFVNFFNYIDAPDLLMNGLSAIRLITTILFVGLLLIVMMGSREKTDFVVIFGIAVLLIILVQVLIFPENNDVFLKTARNFISTIFRIVVLFYVIDDFEKMVHWLRNYSLIISVFLLVELFLRGVSFNNGRYSMALGYICLFPAMVLIYCFKQKHQVVDIIAAIMIIFSITVYASRGPLLCIASYMAFILLKNSKPYITVAILLAIIMLYINYDVLLDLISIIIPSLRNSRTFLYMLDNRMTEASGRIGMYERIWNEFIEHPFAIKGINSDYNVLGVYTHNLFLELLYEFGIIIGGGLCTYIVIRIANEIIKFGDSSQGEWRFMFMAIAIPQLIVSHTLWSEWAFWVWIVLGFKNFSLDDMEKINTNNYVRQ